MSNVEFYLKFLDESDDELAKKMVEHAAKNQPVTSKICQDILILRRNEDLVKQTKELVRKTWWIAIATWALAVATILISILTKR